MSQQQHDRLRAAVARWRRAKGSTIQPAGDLATEAVTRAQLDALRDELRALNLRVNGTFFLLAGVAAEAFARYIK